MKNAKKFALQFVIDEHGVGRFMDTTTKKYVSMEDAAAHLNKTMKEQETIWRRARGILNSLKTETEETAEKIDVLRQAFEQGEISAEQYEEALKRISDQSKEVKDDSNKIALAVAKVIGVYAALKTGVEVIQALGAATVNAYKAPLALATETETRVHELVGMTGSLQAATGEYLRLRRMAALAPIEYDSLVGASRAARALGLELEEGRKLIRQLADATAYTNEPMETFVSLAESGRAAIENGEPLAELQAQLVALGFGIPGILSQIEEMRRQGKSTEAIWRLWISQIDDAQGSVDRVTGTMASQIKQLKLEWENLVRGVGEAGLFDLAKRSIALLTGELRTINTEGPITVAIATAMGEAFMKGVIPVLEFVNGIYKTIAAIKEAKRLVMGEGLGGGIQRHEGIISVTDDSKDIEQVFQTMKARDRKLYDEFIRREKEIKAKIKELRLAIDQAPNSHDPSIRASTERYTEFLNARVDQLKVFREKTISDFLNHLNDEVASGRTTVEEAVAKGKKAAVDEAAEHETRLGQFIAKLKKMLIDWQAAQAKARKESNRAAEEETAGQKRAAAARQHKLKVLQNEIAAQNIIERLRSNETRAIEAYKRDLDTLREYFDNLIKAEAVGLARLDRESIERIAQLNGEYKRLAGELKKTIVDATLEPLRTVNETVIRDYQAMIERLRELREAGLLENQETLELFMGRARELFRNQIESPWLDSFDVISGGFSTMVGDMMRNWHDAGEAAKAFFQDAAQGMLDFFIQEHLLLKLRDKVAEIIFQKEIARKEGASASELKRQVVEQAGTAKAVQSAAIKETIVGQEVAQDAIKDGLTQKEVARGQVETGSKTLSAISKFFDAHAWIPFVGAAIAAAMVALMMKNMRKAKRESRQITAAATGGQFDKPTLVLLAEAGEPEIVAPRTAFTEVIRDIRREAYQFPVTLQASNQSGTQQANVTTVNHYYRGNYFENMRQMHSMTGRYLEELDKRGRR